MKRNLVRQYATLMIKSVGVQAFSDIGDVREGLNLLRREVVAHLKATIPGLTRMGLARMLGITERALDDWWSQARQNGPEGAPDRGEVEEREQVTEDIRFFGAVASLLSDRGEQYASLGEIVDHVKANVNRRLSTRDVQKRLEAYVGRGRFECSPEDPELYRLAVRIPAWVERELPARHAMLMYMLPLLYEIGYQVFVGAEDANARGQLFEIPDSRKAEFVDLYTREYLKFLETLEGKERELLRLCPDEPRSRLAGLFFSGRVTGPLSSQQMNGSREKTPEGA